MLLTRALGGPLLGARSQLPYSPLMDEAPSVFLFSLGTTATAATASAVAILPLSPLPSITSTTTQGPGPLVRGGDGARQG